MIQVRVPRRTEVIKKAKKTGKLLAAVYPIHYPRELLRAFDIHPIEVWGPPGVNVEKSQAHLQSYICSVVHSGLSFLLSGGLKDMDLILVPHCCDSLQGLGSILKDFIKPDQKTLTLYIPREKNSTNILFLKKQLEDLYEELSSLTGKKPDNSRIMEEIELEEELDKLVLRFYKNREGLPLDSFEFYRILRAREYLPPEDFKNLIQNILLKSSNGKLNQSGIILSGIVPEPMDILKTIDDADGFLAADDLACCFRRVYGRGTSNDPFKRMAERIVNGPPDPMKGNSFDERFEFLVELLERYNAKGVLFYNVKFCEPEHFYHPILKEKLSNIGVKSTIIEIDINQPISQQIATRVSAFIEMLKGE